MRIVHKDVQLLNATGLGKTKEQQKVKRIAAKEFMRLRLHYLDVTEEVGFTPHSQCEWKDEDRIEEIQQSRCVVLEPPRRTAVIFVMVRARILRKQSSELVDGNS